MNVLVIGSGGREHALVWKLAQSPLVEKLFAAPGNPGIAELAACVDPGRGTPEDYLRIARDVGAELTVVGPEAPLVAGVVDAFRAAGLRIVGPTRTAAQLEGSKIYAKRFFQENRIPTARFVAVEDQADARRALDGFSYPVVVKADGLAAGKGVIVAHARGEAERAIHSLGGRLVIEEFLAGEEVSFIALSDGRNCVALEPSQDHKAAYDGDRGPNTGGMGAYCDSRILTRAQTEEILDRIIRPTVERTAFAGFLYAGLMMTADGPKLLEYNVRLGDPEAQPILHRLQSDLGQVLLAAAGGELGGMRLDWSPGPSVCVVLASGGYPGRFETGKPITGIEDAGEIVFHAGTRRVDGRLETAGGRVLGVTAGGDTLGHALDRAYAAVRRIHFDGMHYRTDIGRKGLQRYV